MNGAVLLLMISTSPMVVQFVICSSTQSHSATTSGVGDGRDCHQSTFFFLFNGFKCLLGKGLGRRTAAVHHPHHFQCHYEDRILLLRCICCCCCSLSRFWCVLRISFFSSLLIMGWIWAIVSPLLPPLLSTTTCPQSRLIRVDGRTPAPTPRTHGRRRPVLVIDSRVHRRYPSTGAPAQTTRMTIIITSIIGLEFVRVYICSPTPLFPFLLQGETVASSTSASTSPSMAEVWSTPLGLGVEPHPAISYHPSQHHHQPLQQHYMSFGGAAPALQHGHDVQNSPNMTDTTGAIAVTSSSSNYLHHHHNQQANSPPQPLVDLQNVPIVRSFCHCMLPSILVVLRIIWLSEPNRGKPSTVFRVLYRSDKVMRSRN